MTSCFLSCCQNRKGRTKESQSLAKKPIAVLKIETIRLFLSLNVSVYFRHEGRKMKQELRCHAVLCQSDSKAKAMAQRLQERLHQALVDFKKEKVSRQNARLSLANSVYDNPTMPRRKILLHTGSSNYRPPIEKAKSAPKLKVIEEVNFINFLYVKAVIYYIICLRPLSKRRKSRTTIRWSS